MKKCPFCGLINHENTKMCDCGYDFIKKIEPPRTIKNTDYSCFAVALLIIVILYFATTPRDPDVFSQIHSIPNGSKFMKRYYKLIDLKDGIKYCRSKTGHYPKDFDELKQYTGDDIIDIFTNKADWEVCSPIYTDKWYRTSNEPYEPLLPHWSEAKDGYTGIYDIRPRKVTEEIEIGSDLLEKIKLHCKQIKIN